MYSVHHSTAARSGIWILLLLFFSLAKFQISSFIRGSFYSFVQLRSYHIFWEICVERDFLFVKQSRALSGSLSVVSHPRAQMRKRARERRRSGNPFALIQRDLWWKISLSNYRTKICLFVCFHIRIGWCIRKEEGRWGSNKLESKNWLVLLVLSPSTDWLIGFNELFFGEREKTKCYRSFCVGLRLLKICLFSYFEIWKS